ncbi:MAG: PBP1A family penicillin-binding protein [Patescibacteria group bacterium]
MRSRLEHFATTVKHIATHADQYFDAGIAYARIHWRQLIVWGIGGVFVLAGLTLLWASTLQLPDLTSLATRRIDQSVKIYDRTGTVLLYDLSQNAQRTIVPLSAISPNIQQAVISIEDPNFYTHRGIEVTAIARAILADIVAGGKVQGGSTITQQVVKGSILTNDKTITRKLKEWVLSLKIERVLSKDQILELYLNQIPFGGTLYGVEAASMSFYGVHASDLTVPQAAYLAAVLPAPTRLSPYGTHTDQLEVRKNLVLDKMYEHGAITAAERDEYKATKVVFLPPRDTSISAPHFVFYVEQYLENKYGEDALMQGGWTVITTLDADLQTKAEEIVNTNALANVGKYNASNMAMTAVDPKTGQILVMVGSRNYFDTEIPGAYNVAVAMPGRQPGSAFKPFVYAQAFSEGYTPDTVLFDLPTQFSTHCQPSDNHNSESPCYAPVDYDGKFRGPMSLRDALAQSINVPAVKLLYLAGVSDSLKLAKSMGITTLGNPDQYGLTLVLGGGEVTPLEMTSAYGTFAADGMHYNTTPILKVEDSAGNTIEDDTQPVGTQALDATVAQEISDVLSDPVARAPLGENDIFSFPGHDVAVKTGTTNDTRDAWTVGYTPDIAVGVWAGNNDNTPMVKKVSGFIVGPAWSEFMNYALTKFPDSAFTRGTYPVAQKPALRGVWQVPGADGAVHEILYWINKNDPTGLTPPNYNDSQFAYWDYPVQQWAASNGFNNIQPGSIDTTQPQSPFQPNPQQPQQPQQQQYSPSGGAIIPQ